MRGLTKKLGLGSVVAVVAATAVAGVPTPADGARRTKCVELRGIVAANPQAVVLRRTGGFFVCDVRSRRVRSIGGYDADEAIGIRRVSLAGRYVGFHFHGCNSGGCGAAAFLLDVPAGTRRTLSDPQSPGKALGLQVTATGTIAWVRDRSSPEARRYEVVVAKRGAAPVVVEEGPVADFAVGSLATAGGFLYWFAQGRAKSFSLR